MCLMVLTSLSICVDCGVSNGGDADEMLRGILVTAQDFRPGVAVAAHYWCAAVPH